jgi:PAS domain S-box-containing protein
MSGAQSKGRGAKATPKAAKKAPPIAKAKRPADRHARQTAADTRRLHVELQVQNDELVEARLLSDIALERYTELFDFAPMGYAILGADEHIEEINYAGARILGVDRKHVVGRTLSSLVHGSDQRASYNALLARALQSSARETCELKLKKTGGAFAAVVRVRALTRGNRRFLVALEDVTERNDREERLQEAESVLRRTIVARTSSSPSSRTSSGTLSRRSKIASSCCHVSRRGAPWPKRRRRSSSGRSPT